MKTLRQSLVEHDLPVLKAIAERRAVPVKSTAKKSQVIEQLAEALLSPVATAIILDDLTEPEQEALQFLLSHNGQVESARFSRRFGSIRPMGPARLSREQPWQAPANPTEGLWYRGLIYKAFRVAEQGGEELVFIPSDLLPLIAPDLPAAPETPPAPEVALATAPAHVSESSDRLRENFFNILVYLQTHVVKLQAEDSLSAHNRQALEACLLPPPFPGLTTAAELDFLLHLGRRAELLTVARGRLKPNRQPVKQWLQSDASQQQWLLQNSWRADPTWNDLWRVPGLNPQSTGWENSPLRARAAILSYLEQIEAPAEGWVTLDSFIATIKRLDPDFQRPNGDYESWYIQDEQGQSLMGFEHWADVEGALIRYIVTHVLFMLSVVEVGAPAKEQAPTSFRLTLAGESFLQGQPMLPKPTKKPLLFRLTDKFQVKVPAQASLYDRFQLARFAQLEQRDAKRTTYSITQASFHRALKNGVTADQITAFLTRVTGNRIPLRVVETLRAWGNRFGRARLEPTTLLRLEDEQVATEIRRNSTLQSLLGDFITPTIALVPAQNLAKVRQLLVQLGYLGQNGE